MKNKIYGYHILDTRKIKERIKDKIVDITITSPPYWKMKDYKAKNQLGFGQGYNEFLDDLTKIFKDIYDITKDTGSLWVILDTFKENGKIKLLPFDLIERIEKSKIFDTGKKWILHDIIIWDKEKTLPWSRKGQVRNIFEYILFFIKSKNFKYALDRIKVPDESKLKSWWVKYPERYNPHGKAPENIWRFKIPTQGSFGNGVFRHFCPFPPELVEQIILLTTNKEDVVLDPFAGSGIVLAQADCMGRKYIGFDLKKSYKKMFMEHVLGDIHKAWDDKEKELGQLQQRRYSFSRKIKKLRQLKFSKSLIREIKKEIAKKGYESLSINDINSVFAMTKKINGQNSNNRFKFMEEDIYIVFESKVDEEKLHKIVAEVAKKYPLSKFGIEPMFYFFKLDDFITEQMQKELFNGQKLWLYSRGLVNKYDKLITFDEWKTICYEDKWKTNFKNGVPPIISNIKVKIDYKSP